MLRLPVGGRRVRWRATTGEDDLVLAECPPGLAGARAYVARVVVEADGEPVDPGTLPVGDLDLVVVAHRRETRGDTLVAEGTCAHCGAALDVSFSLAAYADHHRPRVPRGARAVDGEPGWWRLPGGDVRVPTVDDVLAAAAASAPRAELLARCWRGPVTRARSAEHAMATLGPTLRADVAGSCLECDREVLLDVDARELCLSELRFLAATVYGDTHVIASAYGWAADEILRLPTARRRRFAEIITGDVTELAEVAVG
ncbi:hypothetical protein [Antribacter gilvus]|uniref:hypothetical protein n=1 Tax=Antribacter gilvus TaxID=2304675 RepID=UPI000F789025|nr:hypothetical protein [Antribacter gilvus]